MSKYEVLPQQLLHEGTLGTANFFAPEPIDLRHILTVHDADYWHRLVNLTLTPAEVRRTGFPLDATLVSRETIIAQGTLQCALYALEQGIAMNIAGGTHHAYANRGEGFCLLNDMAIAARYLLDHQKVKRILVVDLDVHQGNGTAHIFRDEPRVFTFSMHGANNYPLRKEASNLDIGLADFTPDDFYLQTLEANLAVILDQFQPDFLFFQSGVDILDTDKLGRLSVTRDGCRRRDRIVLERCRQHRIPVVVTMGGGYSPDFRDIIEAHANTFRSAQDIFF
jgi:acetoin utilization deacetylase AcuC-like enzyme